MAALALFATLSLGAHPALDAPPIGSITEAVTGTVDALVIEDRIKNATSRYHELQRDDGTTLQLTGAAVSGLAGQVKGPVLLPGVICYHEVLHLLDMGGTLAHVLFMVRYVLPFQPAAALSAA